MPPGQRAPAQAPADAAYLFVALVLRFCSSLFAVWGAAWIARAGSTQTMKRHIILLRGINVGGRHRLSMTDLREALEKMGCRRIETYLQSGNAVVELPSSGSDPAAALAEEIHSRFGFRPWVLVLAARTLAEVLAANPYPHAVQAPTTLHVVFLEAAPDPAATARLGAIRATGESFRLIGRVLYLHAPGGIGRSHLAKSIDRTLGMPATSRNWRTVQQLATLAGVAEFPE